jgi:mediator of replication checkpoint protein 1
MLNAFDVLTRHARAHDKAEQRKKQLEKSEFVETEAQEEDEDEKFGFGILKKMGGDEEEDGEHLDKSLEELVDDRQMDAETQAAELVLEKVK